MNSSTTPSRATATTSTFAKSNRPSSGILSANGTCAPYRRKLALPLGTGRAATVLDTALDQYGINRISGASGAFAVVAMSGSPLIRDMHVIDTDRERSGGGVCAQVCPGWWWRTRMVLPLVSPWPLGARVSPGEDALLLQAVAVRTSPTHPALPRPAPPQMPSQRRTTPCQMSGAP